MKVVVEVNAVRKSNYNEKLLTQIAQETIKVSNISNNNIKNLVLSVAIVDENEIQRINKKLRGQDVVTNVLSIGDYSDEKNITIEKQTEVFLGEVILCYNYIKQSARRNGVDINEEFYTIYAHGILHLLGFTHSKEMFYLQDIVGKKFII